MQQEVMKQYSCLQLWAVKLFSSMILSYTVPGTRQYAQNNFCSNIWQELCACGLAGNHWPRSGPISGLDYGAHPPILLWRLKVYWVHLIPRCVYQASLWWTLQPLLQARITYNCAMLDTDPTFHVLVTVKELYKITGGDLVGLDWRKHPLISQL